MAVASDSGRDAEVLEVNVGRARAFSYMSTSLRRAGGITYAYETVQPKGF